MFGTGAIRVTGIDDALAGLQRETLRIKHVTLKGLIAAGLLIQGEAQRITPVDTSNLKNSAFTIWRGGARTSPAATSPDHAAIMSAEQAKLPRIEPAVEVGFTASYAIYVHEDLMAKHKGDGEAKFLERAMLRNGPAILTQIKMYA